MLAETMSFLTELTSALEQMPNNPAGLAGWILSNYQLRKIGSAEPVNKFFGSKPEREDVDMSKLKIPDNSVTALLARTGSMRAINETQAKLAAAGGGKNKSLAKLAANIATLDAEEAEANFEPPESDGDEDYEQEERGPKLSRSLVTDTNVVDPNSAPLTAEEIRSIAGSIQAPEGDEDSGLELLKIQRMKRVMSQQNILSGNAGSFRRA